MLQSFNPTFLKELDIAVAIILLCCVFILFLVNIILTHCRKKKEEENVNNEIMEALKRNIPYIYIDRKKGVLHFNDSLVDADYEQTLRTQNLLRHLQLMHKKSIKNQQKQQKGRQKLNSSIKN